MEPINISNRKQGHHIPQQATHGFASHSPITPPAYYHSHQPGSNADLSGKDFEIFLGVAGEQGTSTDLLNVAAFQKVSPTNFNERSLCRQVHELICRIATP
jgi:hypothetical protein